MSTTPVFPIIPTTQQYDWGKVGLTSKVAQFASASKTPGFKLDEKAPYAEASAFVNDRAHRIGLSLQIRWVTYLFNI